MSTIFLCDRRPRRRSALLSALLAVMLGSATLVAGSPADATPRTLRVAPGASGDCLSSPCGSVNEAHRLAAGGDVIELAAGSYPQVELRDSTSAASWDGNVVVEAADGAEVRIDGVELHSPRLTFEGLVIDGAVRVRADAYGTRLEELLINGSVYISADDVAVVNSRIRPRVDGDGIQVKPIASGASSPKNVIIQGNDVGPAYRSSTSTAHADTLQVMGVDGLTLRGNHLREASSLTVLLKPDLGPIRGVEMSNNLMEQCLPRRDECRGYYAAMVRTSGFTIEDVGFRNNTVRASVSLDHVPGLRVEHNVFTGTPVGNSAFTSNLVAPGASGHDATTIYAEALFNEDGMTLREGAPGYGWGLQSPVPHLSVEAAPSPTPVSSAPEPDPTGTEPEPGSPELEPAPTEPVGATDGAQPQETTKRGRGPCSSGSPVRASTTLRDVTGSIHSASIVCASSLGLVVGYADGTFQPNQSISRAQFATIVSRLIDLSSIDEVSGRSVSFPDVPEEFTHASAIGRLAGAEIITGYGDGHFRPHAPISRAQSASLLLQVARYVTGRDLPGGADVFLDDDGNVHETSINAASAAGWVRGTSSTTFAPSQRMTRGQVAAVLTRLVESLAEDGTLEAE